MKSLILTYHTIKFWVLITILSILLGVWAIFVGAFDWSGNTSHNVSRFWCRLLCYLNGIKVDIKGMENIRQDTAQVFVANHQSYFDIFTMSGYLPVQIRWMAKSTLFRIPFVGWAMRASGYISVNRTNRKGAYKSFMAGIEQLKAGKSIVIFPEGTRSTDGKVGPFKKGGHLLAKRSKCPMVPVTVIGSGNIIKKKSALIRPGPVRLVISPAIEAADLTGQNEATILESIRATICQNLEEESPE